ncbi:NAD-dependent epimerase/dehydratase family protein [Klebsiella quasipneumoniae]
MNNYKSALAHLLADNSTWLITGVAGFIGSHLLETLLIHNQRVVGLDNFSTGKHQNLDDVKKNVGPDKWINFQLITGDVCNIDHCRDSMLWKNSIKVEHVLHQAALGSIPRSIKEPLISTQVNIIGFITIMCIAKEVGVKSFVYASSSSVYGDTTISPRKEYALGKVQSPYALTKLTDEMFADVFYRAYEFRTIGLRYFNVFGPRQNPDGEYSAVIPRWIMSLLNKECVYINGKDDITRDFTYIDNVVQANILSSIVTFGNKASEVFNIATGNSVSLGYILKLIERSFFNFNVDLSVYVKYRDLRQGDIIHSQADISKAQKEIYYDPDCNVSSGIEKTVLWFIKNAKQ